MVQEKAWVQKRAVVVKDSIVAEMMQKDKVRGGKRWALWCNSQE